MCDEFVGSYVRFILKRLSSHLSRVNKHERNSADITRIDRKKLE